MATDAQTPYLTSLSLFFFLLLMSDTTMADKKNSFPPVTNIRDGAGLKRNSVEFTSRRHGGGKSKTDSLDSTCKTLSTATNGVHVRRRGRLFQGSKPPLPWQEKIYNASEHEVPSGPNPISNR